MVNVNIQLNLIETKNYLIYLKLVRDKDFEFELLT